MIPSVKKDNLVLNLSLTEGSGTTAHDSSGEGNDGTISGASWVKLPNGGYGLNFDGTDDYVDISTIPSFGSNDFTISFWANNFTHNGETYLAKWYGTSTNREWLINWDSTNGLSFYTSSSGSDSSGVSYAGTINSGWHNVVITKSGTTGKIYLDGSLVTTDTVFNSLHSSSSIPTIGAQRVGTNKGAFYTGEIAQPIIFDTALTADEVKKLYRETYIK